MYPSITIHRLIASTLLAATLAACAPQSGAITTPPTAVAVPPTAAPVAPTVPPAPLPMPIDAAQGTVERFLEAYFSGGDAHVYLGGALAAEVAAGRPLHQLVGSQPGYRGFTVHAPEGLPGGGAGLWADITYGDTVVEQRFELAPSLGEWAIVAISVGGRRPAELPPEGSAEWASGPSGDFTGDGVPEQISYRQVELQLPPVGFSDPDIVGLMVASELRVQMEVAPNGHELLSLSQQALVAEGVVLASFDGERPAGFIVVAYGGERRGLHITPLRADGQPRGEQALEVAWNAQEQGYRLK